MIKPESFLIDADGTLFFHDWPAIHAEVPHAIRVIKRIKDAGHVLILHTCRYHETFENAKAWALKNGIHFDHFNENPGREYPSRKVYGNWNIDDHNVGSPMIYDTAIHHKPFVDWLQIERILEAKGLI